MTTKHQYPPFFDLKIAGSPISAQVKADIVSITLDDGLGLLDQLTIEIQNNDM